MFRARQPLRKYCAAPLSHVEYSSNDNGVERKIVSDCGKLDPVSDYDLELNIRAGENLKETSTIVTRRGRLNFEQKEKKQVDETENPNEVENEK